jgi:hypothetical protein
MRQRFEQQLSIYSFPIPDVTFPLKSRDEMPPVLKALHYIFVTPELSEEVFALLEETILKGKKKTGRKGMDLWHILVLSVVRHALNTNWDRLAYLANYDALLRRVLGLKTPDEIDEDDLDFSAQNLRDNVTLLDENLLSQINGIVAGAGHKLLKKKERDQSVSLKTDSYAVEANVHFPTDLNLLYDSMRKCLDCVNFLRLETGIAGWRKIKDLRKKLKSTFRATSYQVFKGRKEPAKKQSVSGYLSHCKDLRNRIAEVLAAIAPGATKAPIIKACEALKIYLGYTDKHIDLVYRRLINGEVIPAEEKVYSIFEPHIEWLTKGKLNKKVELGHAVLITSNAQHYIVDYKLMESERDHAQVAPLAARLKQKYAGKTIYSHSFDKGFYSKANYEILKEAGVEQIVLPKKGKKNKAEIQRESTPEFKKLRNSHSAVESNINMLENHGLGKCVDKGIDGFRRSVGLSVLAYNLHILGNKLLALEKKKKKKAGIKAAA